MDVSENENEFVVKASLPGVKPEDVQITIQGDALAIRGETNAEEDAKVIAGICASADTGAFERSFSLGTPVDSDKADAEYDHGVLTLRLPKAEASKPRQIKIGGEAHAKVSEKKGPQK